MSTCAVAFLIHPELLIIDELSFLDVEDRGVVCECGQRGDGRKRDKMP